VADTQAWSALVGGTIQYKQYDRQYRAISGTRTKRGLIPQFSDVIRKDIGTP
jgi:hypothetical protein